jgi:iron(III) transport system substrate-binding protein
VAARAADKSVVIYSANESVLDELVFSTFTKETGIAVQPVSAGSGVVMKRISSEKERPQGDIVWGVSRSLLQSNAQYFAPYHSKNVDAIPPEYRDPGDLWIGNNLHLLVILQNTKLVPDGQGPKSWDDLLDPKWKGKLLSSDFLLPRLMGFLAIEWGPERAEKWGRTLIDDQKILITSAPPESFLKTGERVMMVGGSVAQAFQFNDGGIPSGYIVMDVMPAVQFVMTTFKDSPHPAAATLLATWLVSEEGRKLFETTRHEADIRPGSKSALAKEIADAKAKVIFEDVATMDQRAEYYKKFSALVRGQ